MIWFWLGFFAFVALLLVLDLGVLHRKQVEPTLKSSIGWTIAWVCLGLSFSGVVYCMYEYNWLGASLSGAPECKSGGDAAMTYVSAYLLEQALSVDNIFVIGLLFHSFRVPVKYQHRVLFWGILGAIGFRVTMLGGGSYLAQRFDWIFYVFGGYLLYQGVQLVREDEEEQSENIERSLAVRTLRRFIRIVDGDHGGKFSVIVDGRRAVTTVAVCLVVIELTDIVFALDSIPAVLSVSRETFVMVSSNIFAIMGLRSLYFVLAGAMAKFKYLKIALAVLLVLIGVKLVLHDVADVPHTITLAVIAGVIGAGVVASVIASRRAESVGAVEPVNPAEPAEPAGPG